MKKEILVDLKGVGKSFHRTVLDNVDFTLHEGEIVALLGESGCGKSTLLRIVAGLVAPDRGVASFRGKPLADPAPGIAMVFQSFALFPWLNVRQNVELGLEAQGLPPAERSRRSAAMLEMMGLAGCHAAMPGELSGGMRQRVGIARALAVNPEVLLLDEAFSALDVITSARLRGDILGLWDEARIAARAMLVVSHNIEEALAMADRILVMSADGGRIRADIRIDLPRPRDPHSATMRHLASQVYGQMAQPC